eukprot:SAG31_NODE_3897_length_3772_cov_2.529540_2_plen_134_part_00
MEAASAAAVAAAEGKSAAEASLAAEEARRSKMQVNDAANIPICSFRFCAAAVCVDCSLRLLYVGTNSIAAALSSVCRGIADAIRPTLIYKCDGSESVKQRWKKHDRLLLLPVRVAAPRVQGEHMPTLAHLVSP